MARGGKRHIVAAVAMALSLAGCATYAPAPVTVSTLAVSTVGRTDLPADGDIHALLRLALAHDPVVAAARASLAAATSNAKAARNLPPLSLTLTAEYSKDADAARPWLYGASAGIPFDAGARRDGRLTAADLAVVKARFTLADAVWNVRQRLHQAISDLHAADEEIRLNQDLFEERQAYQAVLQRRLSHGEDARAPVSQAAIDVSAARQAVAQAQAHRTVAVAALARVLDADPVAVAGLAPVEVTPTALPDDATLAGMIDRALYVRSDVLTAISDYDNAENDLRLAIAAQYPEISLSPGYTWERGQVKLPVSLSLNLPPLDGNRATIAAVQDTRVAAGKTLEEKVKATRATAMTAAATLGADRATAQTLRTVDLPAAQAMAWQTEHLKAAGEADATESLIARMNTTQAEIALARAEQTAANDALTLEDALHQSFDPAETQILTEAMTAAKIPDEVKP